MTVPPFLRDSRPEQRRPLPEKPGRFRRFRFRTTCTRYWEWVWINTSLAVSAMRQLTAEERTILATRRERFDQYFRESMPVLVDFCERLGLPEPYRAVSEPNRFLPAVDLWLQQHGRARRSVPVASELGAGPNVVVSR